MVEQRDGCHVSQKVYLEIDGDERCLGTVHELLDEAESCDRQEGMFLVQELWVIIRYILGELEYGSDCESEATFTIKVK